MEASPPTNNPTHPTSVRRGEEADEEEGKIICSLDRARTCTIPWHNNSPNTKAEAATITKEEVEEAEAEEAEAEEAEDVEKIPHTPT